MFGICTKKGMPYAFYSCSWKATEAPKLLVKLAID